ncbi:MAG: alanine--tRNA ligase-related protein [Candidatus Hermodarchaeota archaeon]
MSKKIFWEDAYNTKFNSKVILFREKSILLEKTLFYPESGNQVSDRGYLEIDDHKFTVEKVTKEGEDILHHISPDFKNKINIGDEVRGEIDWDYRYGIMKAHSSQHILSAIIKSKYNIDTIRANLNFEDVNLQLSQEISCNQLKEVLTEVNIICTSNNLKINSKVLPRKEAEKLSEKIRSAIPNESQVRLMEIEGLDLVCCGGTHVKNTSEIGEIFIYDFKKGTDIKYFVGNKALLVRSNSNVDLITLVNRLNTPIEKLKGIIDKRLNYIENVEEQQKELSIKLLELISKRPLKIINKVSLFYIDINVDIKLLSSMLNLFPKASVIIVMIESNKLRILSSSEKIDANEILQKLIKEYGGKGGGNPKSAQAYLEKIPKDLLSKIELLISNFI